MLVKWGCLTLIRSRMRQLSLARWWQGMQSGSWMMSKSFMDIESLGDCLDEDVVWQWVECDEISVSWHRTRWVGLLKVPFVSDGHWLGIGDEPWMGSASFPPPPSLSYLSKTLFLIFGLSYYHPPQAPSFLFFFTTLGKLFFLNIHANFLSRSLSFSRTPFIFGKAALFPSLPGRKEKWDQCWENG